MMSDELRRRFASLAEVADTRPLSGPAQARLTGHRRTVRRRQSIVFAGGIAVAAVAGTVFATLPSTAPTVYSSPTASTSPSPSVATPPSVNTVPSHQSPGADCSASDLDSHAYFRGNGAAGTLSYEITIRNGSRRCRLGVPKLEGVNVYTGVREAVPFTPSPGVGRTLAPRAYAEVSVRYGSDTFEPNGSPCARPPDYKDVALVFPDGSRYALPRVRLAAHCHGFWGAGWSDSQYPGQPAAYEPAAP